MTASRLTARLDKLGGPKTSREISLEIQPGKSFKSCRGARSLTRRAFHLYATRNNSSCIRKRARSHFASCFASS